MEVGVSVFTGVLEGLLSKLAEMLTDKYKLHKGAKEGIRYIRDELESMQAALEKVSSVPPDQLDKQVKLWARKVREMSYNIEDTIDSFVVRVDATGEYGSSTTCCLSTKSMLPRTCKARGDIAGEIEKIKKEVEEVSKRRERYKVDSIVAPAMSYDPRLLALYEDEAKLVGIDHSREKIIKLLSMEQKLKLVSIVGPGGGGGMDKTTLAKEVHQKLEEKFDCTAFVSVSQEPNLKNILSSVLRQVTSKIKDDPEDKGVKDKSLNRRESQKQNGNTETWSDKEVIDKIRRVLEKRRYLIVIDDIWDEKSWKLIECVLFENNLGSIVIMTTHKIDVAKSCCSSNNVDGIIYDLQPLSHGIDHSREEIMKLLSLKLKLVSIVGPAGMGKTTLANAVLQKLKEKFECTAFVSVSQEPNLKNILSSVLRQVTRNIKDDPEDKGKKDKSIYRQESQNHNGNTETWPDKEVIDKIRRVLEKRRYLIVIDDIWDEKSWKLIECVLFENNLGSRVITTTRKSDVAKSCFTSNDVDGINYELPPLSPGDSEQLFYHKIFGKDGCPAELKVVSQKILEKCEGWPLGIITIASLFASKLTQTEDHWYSVYNSISTGLENYGGVEDMRLILSLSYRDMPSQLRACLLYLSIFPEDHIIERDDLIQRWIAEDLVRGRQGDSHSLYELGDKYFNELVNRSMIQPSDVDALGKAHACKVHDLVLEFITFLSAEEGFVTILNGRQPFPSDPNSIHRLSLRNSKGKGGIPKVVTRLPHVRTLVVSSSAIDSMPSLSIFPALRVLELEHCTSHNIRGVESLVHLRHLRLSQESQYDYDDVCIKLPKGIGRLQFLQILDLKEARIKELPSTVVQFRQLRVLEISLRKWDKRCERHLLQCLSNVKQLEVLCIFAPDLSLDFMLRADWAPRHLQRFTASPHVRTEDILKPGTVWAELSPFSTLPRWIISSFSTLSDLSIMVRTLEQADLDTLADFLILRSVDLEVVKATGGRLEIKSSTTGGTVRGTAFRYLGILKFASRAVGLVFRPGAMQKLQKLYLRFEVAETKDIHGDFDLGLENLTSLKTVNVEVDLRWAKLREVEAAEAALRNATNLNPNRPILDLQWHFQDCVIQHDQEEDLQHDLEIIPEDRQADKKEDALLSRIGPFGGNGGRAHDIRVPPHRLESVTIFSGDVVDSLAFSYTDHNGQQHSPGPWGGPYANAHKKIQLGPSEYLIKVSGTIGSYSGIHNLITSLTFVTNAASYGPFGIGGGDPFVVPVQSNSRIVGFFGRAGVFLDAIGFYVRQL